MFTHNIIMIYYRNRLITVLLEIINNEYDKWIYDISKYIPDVLAEIRTIDPTKKIGRVLEPFS